jgi:hypothetical protein
MHIQLIDLQFKVMICSFGSFHVELAASLPLLVYLLFFCSFPSTCRSSSLPLLPAVLLLFPLYLPFFSSPSTCRSSSLPLLPALLLFPLYLPCFFSSPVYLTIFLAFPVYLPFVLSTQCTCRSSSLPSVPAVLPLYPVYLPLFLSSSSKSFSVLLFSLLRLPTVATIPLLAILIICRAFSPPHG